MKLVRSDKILCLLLDGALAVGRSQFGADGCGNDVGERGRELRLRLRREPADDAADQRFRHSGIDRIHRHLVAIVGAPSKSDLRHVAGADHYCFFLIGHVHQYLCALSRLCILIGGIMHMRIMSDVGEMLHYSR